MNTIIKNIIVGFALLFAVTVSASNPNTDDLDNVNEVIPAIEETIKNINKVNAKEVEHVFMKKKRVDRVLTPKKRLSKVKYTIA